MKSLLIFLLCQPSTRRLREVDLRDAVLCLRCAKSSAEPLRAMTVTAERFDNSNRPINLRTLSQRTPCEIRQLVGSSLVVSGRDGLWRGRTPSFPNELLIRSNCIRNTRFRQPFKRVLCHLPESQQRPTGSRRRVCRTQVVKCCGPSSQGEPSKYRKRDREREKVKKQRRRRRRSCCRHERGQPSPWKSNKERRNESNMTKALFEASVGFEAAALGRRLTQLKIIRAIHKS